MTNFEEYMFNHNMEQQYHNECVETLDDPDSCLDMDQITFVIDRHIQEYVDYQRRYGSWNMDFDTVDRFKLEHIDNISFSSTGHIYRGNIHIIQLESATNELPHIEVDVDLQTFIDHCGYHGISY